MAKTEFDNSNRGVLFINEKDGNPKRPDFRGSVTIVVPVDEVLVSDDGKTATVGRYISAWQDVSSKGTNYLSIQVGDIDDRVHGETEGEE